MHCGITCYGILTYGGFTPSFIHSRKIKNIFVQFSHQYLSRRNQIAGQCDIPVALWNVFLYSDMADDSPPHPYCIATLRVPKTIIATLRMCLVTLHSVHVYWETQTHKQAKDKTLLHSVKVRALFDDQYTCI